MLIDQPLASDEPIVPEDEEAPPEDDYEEDTDDGDEPEPVAAPEPEPERKTETVPVAVVAELRAELRAARAENAPMRKQLEDTQAKLDQLMKSLAKPEEPTPDPSTDPVDFIIAKLQELDRDKQESKREREAREAQEEQAKQVREFNAALANEYRRFASKTAPDLVEAANYLMESPIAGLKALGWDEDAVNNFVNYVERVNAQEAIAAGKSPAQLIWEKAIASGYVPKSKKAEAEEAAKKRSLASKARGIGGTGVPTSGPTKAWVMEQFDKGGRSRAAVMKYFEDGSVHKLPSGA